MYPSGKVQGKAAPRSFGPTSVFSRTAFGQRSVALGAVDSLCFLGCADLDALMPQVLVQR